MNLAELGYDCAIHQGAGGAAGMIVVGAFVVQSWRLIREHPMTERGKQIFDIALKIEE